MDRIVSLLFGIVPPSYFYMVFWELDYLGIGGDHVGHGANFAIGRFSSGDPYSQVGYDRFIFTVYGHAFFGMVLRESI